MPWAHTLLSISGQESGTSGSAAATHYSQANELQAETLSAGWVEDPERADCCNSVPQRQQQLSAALCAAALGSLDLLTELLLPAWTRTLML